MRRRRQTDEERQSLSERLANAFDTSKEVLLDVPKLTFLGDKEVTIENYKGIVEYTDKLLVIETNPHRLRIEGKNLEVKTITQELLYITGIINEVKFREEE